MTITIVHTEKIVKSRTRQRYSSSLLFIIYHCFEGSSQNNDIRKPNKELRIVNRKRQHVITVDDVIEIPKRITIKYVDNKQAL